MSFLVGRLILIGVITSLPACAIIKDFKENLKANEVKSEAQLPYRHSSAEFKVAWNIVQTGNDTVIHGLITNVMNVKVRDIDLNVVVLDTDGKHLSKGEVLSPQNNLNMNDSFAFSVKLKDAIIANGNVLRFIINYSNVSGSWGGGPSVQSSFTVDATTGVAIEEQGKK